MAKNSVENFKEIDENPEIKAFVILQSFDVKKYDKTINVRGVYFDKSRNKWIARYKAKTETPIIKNFFHRYDTQEEAEKEMYKFKRKLIYDLYEKYPKFFIRNTLLRRADKMDFVQKEIFFRIDDMSDDEIIDLLISTKNIFIEKQNPAFEGMKDK